MGAAGSAGTWRSIESRRRIAGGVRLRSRRVPTADVEGYDAAAKAAKVQQKVAAAPTPLTAEDKAKQQLQDSALGLNGDTAAKKKKKKDKNAPKERLQDQAPAPPAAKPEATPIPPKSVRDNGEPVVTPPPSSAPSSDRTTLPPANTPAGGAAVDMQPSTPANPTPTPPPSPQPPQ